MIPRAPLADCANCPARDRAFVPPERAVAPRARLAIVGEGPSRTEVEKKRPFVGASGRMLRPLLDSIGLMRGHVHWTNAVLCDALPADQEVARKCCSKRLQAELQEVAAPVVATLGALATKSVLQRGSAPILKWRGSVSQIRLGEHPTDRNVNAPEIAGGSPAAHRVELAAGAAGRAAPAAWVLPTIHPAFVMRAPQWAWVLKADFARIGRAIAGGFTPPEEQEGRHTAVARTEGELLSYLDGLADEVSFDVETVGLGPISTALVCFVLSDGASTVVVPWSRGRDGREPWWRRPAEVAADISWALGQRLTVTHNGPAFDHVVAERYGIQIDEWDDTLLMTHALHPELPKNLAHVVTCAGLDVPPWKQLEDRTATLERLWSYCGRDGLYTILAHKRLKEEINGTIRN